MAVELLDELIVQILSFLPAKSLLRCRMVCRSWLNLMSSTKFKLMHLHNFNQLNPRYFIRRMDYLVSEEWFSLHFDDGAFTLDGGITDVEFSFNVTGVNLWFRIIGCCHGVVCLCDADECASGSDMIILWNPSIRRKLTLTLPIFKSIEFEFEDPIVVLGFGYDKMSDDYKVVHLFYTHYYRPPRVEVYSVKTGIWREVMFPDDLRCLFVHYNWTPVFFNGSVHWIAYDPTPGVIFRNSILTFDTSSELFGEIQLPDYQLKAMETTSMISVVDEYLAVTYYNDLRSTHKIWVMKEYKNPNSWTLLYDMDYPHIDMETPLHVQNNGNMIVRNYCARASLFSTGYESEMDRWTYVDKYQESLAFLDVGHSVLNKEVAKGLMMIE